MHTYPQATLPSHAHTHAGSPTAAGLTGALPPSLATASSLAVLDLAGNNITGTRVRACVLHPLQLPL